MIGVLVAAGLSGDDLTAFFSQLNLRQMYGLPGKAPSLAGNKKIEKLLEETIGRITFADLRIPAAVVCVDLISRKSVILDEGDVISAILATIAIPVLLPPMERNGMVLVDGGILNNLPFDIARARGATFIVAVDLTNTATYGREIGPLPPNDGGMIARALSITQRNRTMQIVSTVTDIITAQSFNARMAISQPDILLRPYMGSIGLLDFHRWEEGLAVGRTAVQENEDLFVFREGGD